MKHLHKLTKENTEGKGKTLLIRATGKFYTPPFIVERLAHTLVRSMYFNTLKEIRIIDPFCGDGRLLVALIEQACELMDCTRLKWSISAWEYEKAAIPIARANLEAAVKKHGLRAVLDIRNQDTFMSAAESFGTYNCVITNPPWEALKPDRREM